MYLYSLPKLGGSFSSVCFNEFESGKKKNEKRRHKMMNNTNHEEVLQGKYNFTNKLLPLSSFLLFQDDGGWEMMNG